MRFQRDLVTSVGLTLISMPIVVLGAYFQNYSPKFNEWFNSLSRTSSMEPGLGLAIGTSWMFIGAFWILGSLLYIGVLILIATSTFFRCDTWSSRVVRFGFAAICLWAVVATFIGAAEDFRWRFCILGFGEIVAGLGFLSGCILALRRRA
jgi:hypothetical protein